MGLVASFHVRCDTHCVVDMECGSRRGVVIRSSVKEVPKCLLREFPKIVLVEASNAVLAKKGVLRGSFANAVSKVFIECVPKTES